MIRLRALRAIRPKLRPRMLVSSQRFFGAGAETYCGYTHPRRKQYHVVGYTYEQGGPLIQKNPSGLGDQFGWIPEYNICPPGLGKEGKWDYDTLVAIGGTMMMFHLAWFLITLLPGGPTVMYDFGDVKGRHPNNME